MAKEIEEKQISEELHDPVRFLTLALTAMVKQPGGFTLNLDGEELPYALVGCEITHVMVNSAWIGFKHDGCAFRTRGLEDREAFWKWILIGVGTTKARFTKVCGTLHRPEVPQPTERKTSFVPRSQVYGRGAQKSDYRSVVGN